MNPGSMIVGIAGASGAGKSHFAGDLFNRLNRTSLNGNIQIIHEDCYYREQNHLQIAQRVTTNYDHPDAFEHDLLLQHLRAFRQAQSIRIPQYDYAVHNRSEDFVTMPPAAALIVEGILVLHEPRIRKLLDISIFIDVSLDVCLSRRIRRDTQERERDVESVLHQFEKTVRPMFRQFIEPSKHHANLIVRGEGENEVVLQMLVDHISLACHRQSRLG